MRESKSNMRESKSNMATPEVKIQCTLVCETNVKSNDYQHWFQVLCFCLLVCETKVKVKNNGPLLLLIAYNKQSKKWNHYCLEHCFCLLVRGTKVKVKTLYNAFAYWFRKPKLKLKYCTMLLLIGSGNQS